MLVVTIVFSVLLKDSGVKGFAFARTLYINKYQALQIGSLMKPVTQYRSLFTSFLNNNIFSRSVKSLIKILS